MMKKILVFSMTEEGGLAEYIFCQAEALHRRGHHVMLLCSPAFFPDRQTDVSMHRMLHPMPSVSERAVVRKLKLANAILANYRLLAKQMEAWKPDVVLLDSYREYFSPLWYRRLLAAKRNAGVFVMANLHDPVRNFQVGPAWWHNRSVRKGYAFLDAVLVHADVPEQAKVPSVVKLIKVPHGIFALNNDAVDGRELRQNWGVRDGDTVLLSFGFIRDNKNIDLLMEAVQQVPKTFLVVAGRNQSGTDKPLTYYKSLAIRLGIVDRCVFDERFIPAEDIATIFAASDIVALTYSATFYSQSGVLNIAAAARKPVIVSAAPGALLETVKQFGLGILVTPDQSAAIAEGLRTFLLQPPKPDWDAYIASAGWDQNAELMEEHFPTT